MEQENTTLPWLIFHIRGSCFAVDSSKVGSILRLPDNICPVPEASPVVRGIFDLRGTVLPLLDLRMVFGYSSVQKEYEEFIEMLETRKRDHVHWVEELQRSVEDGTEFKLATDPHKCAFGKWYDKYHSDIDSVNLLLRRIDEPHRQLHAAALEVERCKKNCDACEREECLKSALERAEKEYMPEVLELLEEAKEVFSSNYREMVIVLEEEERRVGVIVDDVLAVDQITPMKADEMNNVHESNYVSGMGASKAVEGNILLLDEEKLLRMF